MTDMSSVIVPKSDQLNADSLVAGPMTIKITGVDIRGGTEQPVSIHYENEKGAPWKPCKSMSRILVAAWGPDANKYVGRAVTLYRDPTVKWAGMEVGGIRISHMSHLDGAMTMALTATKGSRKPYTVRPLADVPAADLPPPKQSPAEAAETFANSVMADLAQIEADRDPDAFTAFEAREKAVLAKLKNYPELVDTLTTRIAEIRNKL